MKEKKVRSLRDIVRSALRKAWLFSTFRTAVIKAAKHPEKQGWWRCAICLEYREKVQVDHITAIGPLNEDLSNLLTWTNSLFHGAQRALCRECHKTKTSADMKLIRAVKRLKGEKNGNKA